MGTQRDDEGIDANQAIEALELEILGEDNYTEANE